MTTTSAKPILVVNPFNKGALTNPVSAPFLVQGGVRLLCTKLVHINLTPLHQDKAPFRDVPERGLGG